MSSTTPLRGPNTTTTTTTGNPQESEKRRIVGVSRVVWEQVLVPWVLAPARAALWWNKPLAHDVVSCLLRAGEALFPLVALCCRAASPTHREYRALSAHFRSIEDAAAALCPKCIAWIVRDKAARRAGTGRGGSQQEGGPAGTQRESESEMGSDRDRGRERERERGRAKEQVAVLTGLCRGGHLRAARAFVGNNCGCWVDVDVEAEAEGGTNKALWLWPPSSSVRCGVGEIGNGTDPQAGAVVPSLLNWNSVVSMENEPVLAEEFWSERGVFKIMREVCVKGHLDVLKWILSSFFQINQGNKILLIPLVHEASESGHLNMLKWLVHTFDLIHFAESNRAAEYFKASDSVHDLKRLVESFPEWQPWFDGKHLALSAGLFKGSATADEIIEVCQWLKDHFSLSGLDFMNWLGMPKHTKVIKWALSDIPASELGGPWSWSCCQLGDVELAKWFIEEKGIIPTDSEFIFACTSPSDNLGFVQWLFKQVSTSSSELLMALKMALACQNDSISKWLEQRYIATAGTRPKFSLAELMETSEENSTNRHEDWLDWLFGHSSLCDIDHSEPELAEFMDQVSQSNSQFQVDVAVSAWKKFPSLSPITHHERMLDLFHSVLFYGNKVQEFASFGELTRSELQQCMDYYYPYSSKVGKWLVRECCFSDPHAEVTVKNFPSSCGLFFASIQVNKRGFVKWLFNTFHFTFDEVLSELKTRELGNDVDLATWKLLMRLFPSEITRDVLITHPNLMMVATATPLHAEFTLKRVPGVTIDDIKQCSSDHALRWMRPTVSHRQMIDIWAGGQWS